VRKEFWNVRNLDEMIFLNKNKIHALFRPNDTGDHLVKTLASRPRSRCHSDHVQTK
jgi:hypothetical protein